MITKINDKGHLYSTSVLAQDFKMIGTILLGPVA